MAATLAEVGIWERYNSDPEPDRGDYLSVARARGAQVIRSTSELTKHTLSGILPVAEDWHAKVCLMEVGDLYILFWKILCVENSVLPILSKLFGFLILKFSVWILSIKCSSLENCMHIRPVQPISILWY